MLGACGDDSLKVHEESNAAGHLGIDIHRNENGSIELKQTGLIDHIVAALHLESFRFPGNASVSLQTHDDQWQCKSLACVKDTRDINHTT